MTNPQESHDYDGSSGQVTRSNSTDSSFDYLEIEPKSTTVFAVSTPISGSSHLDQHVAPDVSAYPQPSHSTSEYPTLTSGYQPLQSPLGSLHSVPLTPWPYPYNSATPITMASTQGLGLFHSNTGTSHPPHSAGSGMGAGAGAWSNVYFGSAGPQSAIGLGYGTFGNLPPGQPAYAGMENGLGTGGIGTASDFGAGAGMGLESGTETGQAYTGLSPLFAGFTTTSPITPFSAQHPVRPALASLSSVPSFNSISSTSTDGSWATARKRSSTMQTLESAASASPATPSSYQAHDYLSFIPNLPSRSEGSVNQDLNQMESLQSSFSSFSSFAHLDQSAHSTPATPFPTHPHPSSYPSTSTRAISSTSPHNPLGAHRTPHSAHPDNQTGSERGTPHLIRHPSAPSMFSMAMTRHRLHPTSTSGTIRRVVPPKIDLSAGTGGSDEWWGNGEGEGRCASSGLGGFGQRDSVEKAPRFKPTKEQQAMLIGSYNENKNPGTEARARLAKAISTVGPETSQKTVQIWFQNRRSKARAKERSLNLPKSAVRSRSTTVDSTSIDVETLRALTHDDSPDLYLVPLSVLCVGTWTRFLTPGNGMLNPDLGAAIAFDDDPRLMLYVVHKSETFRISIALQRDNVGQLEVAAQSNLHINTDAVAVRFALKAGTAVFASWKRDDAERSEFAGSISAEGMSRGVLDMSQGVAFGEGEFGDRCQSDGTGDGRWTPVDDFTGGEASKGGRCELTGEKETLLPGFARIQAWLQSGMSSGKVDAGGKLEMSGSGLGGIDFGSWRFPQNHDMGQHPQAGQYQHQGHDDQGQEQHQLYSQHRYDPHHQLSHSQTNQSSPVDGVIAAVWPGPFSPGSSSVSGFPLESSTTPISATTGYDSLNFAGYYANTPGISPSQAYSHHSSVSTDSPDLSPREEDMGGYRQRAISAPVPISTGYALAVDHPPDHFTPHDLGDNVRDLDQSPSHGRHLPSLETSRESWMETGISPSLDRFGDLTTPKSGQTFGNVFKRERETHGLDDVPRTPTTNSESTSTSTSSSLPAPYTTSNSTSASISTLTSTSSTPVSSSKAGSSSVTPLEVVSPTSARQESQDVSRW